MKEIREPSVILDLLEGGQLADDLREEIEKVLKILRQQSGDRSKARGSIKLTLSLTVDSGVHCTIDAAIDSSVPKEKRPSTLLFVTRDGALSQDHPQQLKMELRAVDKNMEIG